MRGLAPPALTAAEQKAVARVTAANLRDQTICSMALGTGLRLAELVAQRFSRPTFPIFREEHGWTRADQSSGFTNSR